MKHDDIITIRDIHGDEEQMRVLYKADNGKWCKSLTKPHAKKKKIAPTQVLTGVENGE